MLHEEVLYSTLYPPTGAGRGRYPVGEDDNGPTESNMNPCRQGMTEVGLGLRQQSTRVGG